jgi:hypothetical protein
VSVTTEWPATPKAVARADERDIAVAGSAAAAYWIALLPPREWRRFRESYSKSIKAIPLRENNPIPIAERQRLGKMQSPNVVVECDGGQLFLISTT